MNTDQPGESLKVHRAALLNGVEFWSVTGSTRLWSMHHDTFTASLVLGPTESMRAKWRYRGRDHVVGAGDVQLMEPGEVHFTTGVSEPAAFFVTWLPPEVIQACAHACGLRGPVHLRESQTAHPLLSSALRRLHESVERGESLLEIEQGVAESTTRLLELCSESPVRSTWLGRNHPAVRKARAYLEEHFAETVSLDGLAREVGVSKYHLVRTFTESVGSSPHRYQVLLRLCAAQRRMEAGDSVRDAAAATGFADEPHLCRTFRTWLGISPGSWSRGRR